MAIPRAALDVTDAADDQEGLRHWDARDTAHRVDEAEEEIPDLPGTRVDVVLPA
ncbi:hypothetical protein [Streptomyces sp. bgisy032]|uniref:hypothetical protein n=1 Tax=Streptomyces sp. bgisy032 TaxID=3413773 RepID=UPI003D722DAC